MGALLSNRWSSAYAWYKDTPLRDDGTYTQLSDRLDKQALDQFESAYNSLATLAQVVYDSEYIRQTLSKQYEQTKKQDDTSKKNIYKIRQLTLLESYNQQYYRFMISILIFSLFIIMLCLSLGGLFQQGAISLVGLCAGVGVAALVYLIGMLVAFHKMRRRSRLDWNELYFRPGKTVQQP